VPSPTPDNGRKQRLTAAQICVRFAHPFAFPRPRGVAGDGPQGRSCLPLFPDQLSLVEGGLAPPHHIKIDVDGLEHRVVDGMIATLQRPELKTVLIEINFDNPKNLLIVDRMAELGWRFSWEQLRTNRSVKFSVEQIRNYQQRGVGGLNYIFYKDDFYDGFFARLFDQYVPGEPIDVAGLLSGLRG
jgi:hypothetical protein